jgi:putative NADH-flavin reductase
MTSVVRTLLYVALLAAPRCAQALEITVIGGNGMIGQRIVAEALARGHEVQMVVRDPAHVKDAPNGVQIVQGDALDETTVAKLAAGQDALVSAVGAARAATPDYELYLKAARSLTQALRTLGEAAPRLLVVGGVGSLKDAQGRLLLERAPEDRKPEHLGQRAALDFYRTVHDVRWTYVSPPARIAPGERRGAYRRGQDELVVDSQGASAISMEDFAVAIIDEIERPQSIRQRFTVAY